MDHSLCSYGYCSLYGFSEKRKGAKIKHCCILFTTNTEFFVDSPFFRDAFPFCCFDRDICPLVFYIDNYNAVLENIPQGCTAAFSISIMGQLCIGIELQIMENKFLTILICYKDIL
ncbi:MAG TPA: hypothetical protein VHO70_12645, partial [Chitinispirillaceae bacterium]|nr:hypothetical protein [Chitinispirillaceae bacterium]